MNKTIKKELIKEIEKELPVDFKKQAWWGNLSVILIPQALDKAYEQGLKDEAERIESLGIWFPKAELKL